MMNINKYLYCHDQRLLRIVCSGFSLLILFELFIRWPLRHLLYEPTGILTPTLLQRFQGNPPRFTLLNWFNDEHSVLSCFLITGVMAVIVLIRSIKGKSYHHYFLILVIGIFSIYGRCWLSDTSAVFIQRSSLLFLLLATYASYLGQVSWLNVGLRLQLALIYLFNALQKTGETWKSGEALTLFLQQDRINQPLALYIIDYIPPVCLQAISWFTLLIELTLPFLILSHQQAHRLRLSGIFLIIILHGSMILVVDLSLFPITMITLSTVLLTSKHLDWLETRLSSIFRKTSSLEESNISHNSKFQTQKIQFFTRQLTIILTAILMVMCCWGTLRDNPLTKKMITPLPYPLRYLRRSLDLKQWWSLYAPNVPRHDGWVVIGLWTGKKWIDPRSGLIPHSERLPSINRHWSSHLERLSHYLARSTLRPLRPQFQKWWMKKALKRGALKSGISVLGGEVWWVSEAEPTANKNITFLYRWGDMPCATVSRQPCWRTTD